VPDYEAETPRGTYVLRALDDIFSRRFKGYVVSFRTGRSVRHLRGDARIRSARHAMRIAAADYRRRARDGGRPRTA
jgi:hypothetical protein